MSRSGEAQEVAVVGATGQQGGATVQALLAAGARVRGLTRDPSSASAKALTDRGVEMVRGDAGDRAGLRSAFAGVDAAFVMTTPFGGGTERETVEGNAFVDAVRDVGVPRLVFSSVGGADRGTGIPHFESKRRVEEHIGELGLAVTFVRPVYFMENLTAPSPAEEGGTLVLRMPLPPGVPLQMVAVRDIGAAAAAALLDPGRVPGGSIELVGDEVTGEQAAAAFGRAGGVPARYEALPLDVLPDEDLKAMFTWFAHPPAYRGDLDASRRLVPDLHDLPGWLAEQG
jgi:uncharacterized protein YbjT (DUF2867 family)